MFATGSRACRTCERIDILLKRRHDNLRKIHKPNQTRAERRAHAEINEDNRAIDKEIPILEATLMSPVSPTAQRYDTIEAVSGCLPEKLPGGIKNLILQFCFYRHEAAEMFERVQKRTTMSCTCKGGWEKPPNGRWQPCKACESAAATSQSIVNLITPLRNFSPLRIEVTGAGSPEMNGIYIRREPREGPPQSQTGWCTTRDGRTPAEQWARYVHFMPWFEKDDGCHIYFHVGKYWKLHDAYRMKRYEHRHHISIQNSLGYRLSNEIHHYHGDLPKYQATMARYNRPCLPGQCPDCDGYGVTPRNAGACGTCLGTGGNSGVPPAQGWRAYDQHGDNEAADPGPTLRVI